MSRKMVKFSQEPTKEIKELNFEHGNDNLSLEEQKFTSKININSKLIQPYTMPFWDPKKPDSHKEYTAEYQAEKIFADLKKIIELKRIGKYNRELRSRRVCITYSANNQQAEEIINGYKTKEYNIQGINQAAVFELLVAKIKQEKLEDYIHILPIATSIKAGGVGEVNEEIFKRDMANIAKHLGAGWTVLALGNQYTVANGKIAAIGGGTSTKCWKDWDKTCQETLKYMSEHNLGDPDPENLEKYQYLQENFYEGEGNSNALLSNQYNTKKIPKEYKGSLQVKDNLLENCEWEKIFENHENFKFIKPIELGDSNENLIGYIEKKLTPEAEKSSDSLVDERILQINKNSLELSKNTDDLDEIKSQVDAIIIVLRSAINQESLKISISTPLEIEPNTAFNEICFQELLNQITSNQLYVKFTIKPEHQFANLMKEYNEKYDEKQKKATVFHK